MQRHGGRKHEGNGEVSSSSFSAGKEWRTDVGRLRDEASQHQRQRIFDVTLECGHPPRRNGPVYRPVIRTQGRLHDLSGLETAFLLRSRDESRLCGTDGKNAGLRRVDDSGELGDVVHAEIRDGEGSPLPSMSCKRDSQSRLEEKAHA